MTFEDYMSQIEQLHILPEGAIPHIPRALSDDVKMRLMRLPPAEAAQVLKSAIDVINAGSVESVDSLTRKKL